MPLECLPLDLLDLLQCVHKKPSLCMPTMPAMRKNLAEHLKDWKNTPCCAMFQVSVGLKIPPHSWIQFPWTGHEYIIIVSPPSSTITISQKSPVSHTTANLVALQLLKIFGWFLAPVTHGTPGDVLGVIWEGCPGDQHWPLAGTGP